METPLDCISLICIIPKTNHRRRLPIYRYSFSCVSCQSVCILHFTWRTQLTKKRFNYRIMMGSYSYRLSIYDNTFTRDYKRFFLMELMLLERAIARWQETIELSEYNECRYVTAAYTTVALQCCTCWWCSVTREHVSWRASTWSPLNTQSQHPSTRDHLSRIWNTAGCEQTVRVLFRLRKTSNCLWIVG